MIDYIKLSTELDVSSYSLASAPFHLGRLVLYPCINPKTGICTCYEGYLHNLKLRFTGNQLTIENSLHKLIHGNNYCDFTFRNLTQSIYQIRDSTSINPEKLKIIKLEFGLNIHTEEKPTSYLPRIGKYGGIEFDKMKSRSFWYGVKYNRSEYALKLYDKVEQVKRAERKKIEGNILRIEIQYFKNRRIPKVNSLSDLLDRNNLDTIFFDFMRSVSKVDSIVLLNFDSITSRDREMFFAGMNNEFWVLEKGINKETAKKKRGRFKAIKEKVKETDLMSIILGQLNQKYIDLTKSNSRLVI